MKILSRQQIEQCVDLPEIIEAIEKGFIAYSAKETVIPPVATLHFADPPGECHIKYGYAKKGRYYVVKIASGFRDNPKLGIPAGNGLMLLFDKQTGALLALLQDEGYLTDLRTAIAGTIAAKYLAPKNIACVGIVGTGGQAVYQLKLLEQTTSCRNAMIWGRDRLKAEKLMTNPRLSAWKIAIATDLDHLAKNCNLIVTTTSSATPLLYADQILPGTHITAVGADDAGKQELDPETFAKADKVVVDSRSQCTVLGDSAYAIKKGIIQSDQLLELGEIIQNPSLGRTSETQITIADLTGVAIQDLQIASTVYERFTANAIQYMSL